MSRSERLKAFWQEVRDGKRPAPKRDPNAPVKRMMRFRSTWTKSDKIILTIYPHGELGFREPHRRVEYRLGLHEAYRQAVYMTLQKIGDRVKQLRKEGYGLAEARRKARKEVM